MESPKLLYAVWLLALVAVIALSLNGGLGATDFQGIADSKDVTVSSQNAVEIKALHVIPGQEVRTGDLLVELDRPELTLQINEISHELEEAKNQRSRNTEEIRAKIRQIKAQEATDTSEIDYKIKQLTTQQDFNKKLTTGLKSIPENDGASGPGMTKSTIQLEIESLKKKRELAQKQVGIDIDALQAELDSSEDPLATKIQSLKNTLGLLLKEKEKLLIYARINGVVGSVLFKNGEKASPFAPILTLYTKRPSYVEGYIHENLYNHVTVGEKVLVSSRVKPDCVATGEVVGVGSRIVEYPARLRKQPKIQMWGREVQIKLLQDNSFLLGEKVMIRAASGGENSYLAAVTAWWKTGKSYLASLNPAASAR